MLTHRLMVWYISDHNSGYWCLVTVHGFAVGSWCGGLVLCHNFGDLVLGHSLLGLIVCGRLVLSHSLETGVGDSWGD